MKTPYWCTSVVHQYGDRKIVQTSGTNFGFYRRLIISTEKTNIYRRTFPNALTSKRAQNEEISIYFSTNSIVALCHASP